MNRIKKTSQILILGIIFLTLSNGLSLGAPTFEGLNRELDKLTSTGLELGSAEDNSVQESIETDNNSRIVWEGLFRVGIVLILIVIAIWFAGRFLKSKFTGRLQGKWIKVVDEVVLGYNRGVVLCKVEDRIFALGITEQQINYLFTIDDMLLLQAIEEQEALGSADRKPLLNPFEQFIQNLKKWIFSRNRKQSKDFHALIQKNLDRVTPLTFTDEREENHHDTAQK